MEEQFYTKQLPNGLMLLGQHMPSVASAAMTLAVQAGSAYDPSGAEGAAAIGREWCLRGAGERDTRQLNEALDNLGCQHNESVRSEHMVFSAAQLGRNLHSILEIYSDILRRPRLGEDTFDACRELTAQDLASLEDEPDQKCNMLVREKFYPWPLGRCVYGSETSLQSMKAQVIRDHLQAGFSPMNTILSVAGNIDWEKFCDEIERMFGDWTARPLLPLVPSNPQGGQTHIVKDSAQTHIAFAQQSVTIGNPLYYAARMAETVLSGGSSSRLFTEVREKRGLVYHVSSRYHSLKNHAGMFTYAGTPPERAQQTFDVTVGELRRLREGIEPAEMARARTQLKSALIMQGESTSARASALASDWYHLGRLRGLAELKAAIDSVTVEQVMQYVEQYPARNLTVLVIGPKPIDSSSISE